MTKPATKAKTLVELQELEATVRKMRELGVTEFGAIKLGPTPVAPKAPPTKEQLLERQLRAEERRRDLRFAASSIKPVLPPREDT